MLQNEKIEKINVFFKSDGRMELYKEDITDSLINKLYDLMFMSTEFNEDEIIDSNELFYFGSYYHIIKKYDTMKRYYLRSIELNNSNAMNNLGTYYKDVEKDYTLMKRYYLRAIRLNNSYAMNNLGYYYGYIEINSNLMKKYYLKAIELNNSEAMNNLGMYYYRIDCNLMKKYLVMAVKIGNTNAIENLKYLFLIVNTDYSFLELYDCDHFKKCCTDLINRRFKCDNIICLPNKYKQLFLKLNFDNNDNIDNIVKIKQNIYKLTLIFPSNYNSEYMEQFRAIESIVKSNRCDVLNKDLLLHIAGRLFI